jgi:cyclopropane fatty-acyl-phospholipid synthase-like methyltransferase
MFSVVVVDMLHSLWLETGHQVLELGTGAGRNAELAAARPTLVALRGGLQRTIVY